MACATGIGGQLTQDRDPFRDEPTVVAWAKHVLDKMVPAMEQSGFVISISPTKGLGDVKYWVELGASIMMDKPIIVVALAGQEVPKKLQGVADEIVYLPDGVNPQGSAELMEAISRLAARLDKEGNGDENRNS